VDGWMQRRPLVTNLINRQMNHGNSETVTPIQHRSNIGLVRFAIQIQFVAAIVSKLISTNTQNALQQNYHLPSHTESRSPAIYWHFEPSTMALERPSKSTPDSPFYLSFRLLHDWGTPNWMIEDTDLWPSTCGRKGTGGLIVPQTELGARKTFHTRHYYGIQDELSSASFNTLRVRPDVMHARQAGPSGHCASGNVSCSGCGQVWAVWDGFGQ